MQGAWLDAFDDKAKGKYTLSEGSSTVQGTVVSKGMQDKFEAYDHLFRAAGIIVLGLPFYI